MQNIPVKPTRRPPLDPEPRFRVEARPPPARQTARLAVRRLDDAMVDGRPVGTEPRWRPPSIPASMAPAVPSPPPCWPCAAVWSAASGPRPFGAEGEVAPPTARQSKRHGPPGGISYSGIKIYGYTTPAAGAGVRAGPVPLYRNVEGSRYISLYGRHDDQPTSCGRNPRHRGSSRPRGPVLREVGTTKQVSPARGKRYGRWRLVGGVSIQFSRSG